MSVFTRKKPAAFGASDKWIEKRDAELAAEREHPALSTAVIRNSEPYRALQRVCDEQAAEIERLQKLLDQYRSKGSKSKRSTSTGEPHGRRAAREIQHTPDGDYYPITLVCELKDLHQSNVSRQRHQLGINVRYFSGIQHIHADDLHKIQKKHQRVRR